MISCFGPLILNGPGRFMINGPCSLYDCGPVFVHIKPFSVKRKIFYGKMACNSGTCQSGCYGGEDPVDDGGRREVTAAASGGESDHASARRGGVSGPGVCLKCKINEPIAVTHPAVAAGGGECRRFCADCFRSNLFGKFRLAVTSNAMILPTDRVLVAFSGGSASRYFCVLVCVCVWFECLFDLEIIEVEGDWFSELKSC